MHFLRPGAAVSLAVLVMAASSEGTPAVGAVSGRVVDGTGAAVASAQVSLTSAQGSVVASGRSTRR